MNFYQRTLPSVCIDFSSAKGQQVFKNALDEGFMKAYFKLGPQLRTQDEPAYCGLSSLVIVLNALSVDPGKVWKGVWRWYHEDMLDCCTSLDTVKVQGTTIDQISCIAKCNQLESEIVYADANLTVDLLRNEIKSACQSANKALIVSFGRKVLGQTGSGHFAPVGGYSEKDDLVLVLEPARFKYPPFWITTDLLFEAMKTVDPVAQKPRGYLILQKSNYQPPLLFRLSRALNAMQPVNEYFVQFIQDSLKFLKQQVPKKTETETMIMDLSKNLLSLSKEIHLKHGGRLFFITAELKQIEVLSPEHQDAINMLVEKIESTDIFQHVLRQVQLVSSCSQSSTGCSNHLVNGKSCKIVCPSSECVLCIPHYLTLTLFILPIFSPNHSNSTPNIYAIPVDEYSGSYLERVSNFVNEIVFELRSTLRKHDELSCVENDSNRNFISIKLFLNEIEQLQSQLLNILNFDSQSKVCCGFLKT